jgi:hypothetical protein
MRKLSLRILVALTTLIISVSSSWLLHRLRHPKPLPAEPVPCSTSSPSPQTEAVPYEADNAEYPDESPLSPWEISWFIDEHPEAKLDRLWERLHVQGGEYSNFSECGNCAARLEWYDLDNKPGDEAVLKISDDASESYRYLVFKPIDETGNFRFIGHIDEWGKYRESQSFVAVGGGRSWLVTQGQSASGCGVAYYHNRVFEMAQNRLIEVASYQREGYQSEENEWPIRKFSTRILDIRKQGGRTRIKVEFNSEYLTWFGGDTPMPLFSKRQLAVFVSSHNSNGVLDPNESTVTPRELEHMYEVDSMTENDFLKYNLSELLTLAARGDRAQKAWLKSLLKTCGNGAEKQRLLAALAK